MRECVAVRVAGKNDGDDRESGLEGVAIVVGVS